MNGSVEPPFASRLAASPEEIEMKLSRHEVESIAHLARLQITGEEIPVYVENLSRIIDFVNQLERADTEGVEPMAHPLNMTQPLRPDEVTESDCRNLYQENASATESGLYLVPKVIE
jgi:aspartyl-tRNA(Asn)/glutamyl-tRNA(Gln) amidotransferase subunit C